MCRAVCPVIGGYELATGPPASSVDRRSGGASHTFSGHERWAYPLLPVEASCAKGPTGVTEHAMMER